ncbi:MAG: copper resistance protein B [Vicinamibacterales bacterium]
MRAFAVCVVLLVPIFAAAQEPNPVPPVTEEDRRAAFPDVHGHTVHDTSFNYKILFDQLEWQYLHGNPGLRWDTTNWFGGDHNRLWVKSEGEAVDGVLDEANIRIFYGRSLSRWFDWLVGVRHDMRPSPTHTWLAIGVHGLAPQWFDVEATAYVGPSGHVAARLEAEYELLLTQRVVLQPLVELSLSAEDPDRGVGAGLSTGEVGFRVRYELRRELAPYAGVVWHRKLFGTADFARAEGRDIGGWHIVAGVRTWF